LLLAKHFGCVRWVYNKGLAMKMAAWNERKESLSKFDLCKNLPQWKREEETAWLSEVNAQSLQTAFANLDAAYAGWFRRKDKSEGFPKFKSKHNRQSFQVPQCGGVGDVFVTIPKVKKIRAEISRAHHGLVKTITISMTRTGKYFASVLCDDCEETPDKLPVTEQGTVGIDLGLKHFATLSTGEKVENPRHLKWSLRKLRRASRQLSRKKKGSNNRNKARLRMSRVYEQIANRRNDFLHKLSTRIVNDNQVDSVAIEDLAVSNMVKNVRLARHISDAGWSEFRRQLTYKAERAGKNVLVIGRFWPSSKLCSCGVVNHELKLSDRTWKCGACGTMHGRDLLAARNIKRMALHPQNFVGRGTPEFTLGELAEKRASNQEWAK
jgi:putative transposase